MLSNLEIPDHLKQEIMAKLGNSQVKLGNSQAKLGNSKAKLLWVTARPS